METKINGKPSIRRLADMAWGLSTETRLKIGQTLIEQGNLFIAEIWTFIGRDTMSQPALWAFLRKCKEKGLLEVDKRGQYCLAKDYRDFIVSILLKAQ